MQTTVRTLLSVVMSIATLGLLSADEPAADRWDGKIVQYGEMHEAIGRQQHQGRVPLGRLLEREHFYAVAALEGLNGEITIHDGALTVTRVDANGRPLPVQDAARTLQATLLAGAYVPAWTEQTLSAEVRAQDLDAAVARLADEAGIDTSRPFPFVIEGEFRDVRLHVINGACPMHARIHDIEVPADRRPYEQQFARIRGTLVGIYARDAVGKLTHPATSMHTHLLFQDEQTAAQVTGHLERAGVVEGALVKWPR